MTTGGGEKLTADSRQLTAKKLGNANRLAELGFGTVSCQL
jgi:hypothetical protein